MSSKDHVLYMLEDVSHNRLPVFVGTMEEMVVFTGKSKSNILSQITHAKQRGSEGAFIKLGRKSFIDNLEV